MNKIYVFWYEYHKECSYAVEFDLAYGYQLSRLLSALYNNASVGSVQVYKTKKYVSKLADVILPYDYDNVQCIINEFTKGIQRYE